jgi:hypothetical protein
MAGALIEFSFGHLRCIDMAVAVTALELDDGPFDFGPDGGTGR